MFTFGGRRGSGGGGGGDVVGPASSVDDSVVRFDGVTGKLIQGSTVIISDTGAITGALSLTLSSLTSGRIPIISTAGLLVDDADLTFSTDTLTATKVVAPTSVTSPLVIGGTSTTSTLQLRSTSGAGTMGADIIFQTGNNGATEAMRILNSGNVGIGATNPTSKLQVSSSTNSAFALQIFNDGTTDAHGVYINIGASSTGIPFRVDKGGSVLLQASNNGNVGIGTGSPSELLDVNSDAIRIRTAQTPSSAGAAGDAGQVCWDSGFIYVCVATNTWKRSAITTWV